MVIVITSFVGRLLGLPLGLLVGLLLGLSVGLLLGLPLGRFVGRGTIRLVGRPVGLIGLVVGRGTMRFVGRDVIVSLFSTTADMYSSMADCELREDTDTDVRSSEERLLLLLTRRIPTRRQTRQERPVTADTVFHFEEWRRWVLSLEGAVWVLLPLMTLCVFL